MSIDLPQFQVVKNAQNISNIKQNFLAQKNSHTFGS